MIKIKELAVAVLNQHSD
jgi:hypothetical protein